MFNEATQNIYEISYDEYITRRRVISDLLVQCDIRLSQKVNSLKYSISAHQTKDRFLTPNKNINIAKFYLIDLRKYYVEVDGQRYPRDSISKNYTENDYIDQYRDLKIIFREHIGEPVLNPLDHIRT